MNVALKILVIPKKRFRKIMKLQIASALLCLVLDENASGYIRDQCYYLQADEALFLLT